MYQKHSFTNSSADASDVDSKDVARYVADLVAEIEKMALQQNLPRLAEALSAARKEAECAAAND
jgi:hypothetical protein